MLIMLYLSFNRNPSSQYDIQVYLVAEMENDQHLESQNLTSGTPVIFSSSSDR
jgi:hypothetical protein